MKEIRTLYRPIEILCDVQYYVLGIPETDPHFQPDPSFVVDNLYFETRTEAEDFCRMVSEQRKGWVRYKVCEEITPLDEAGN